MREQDSEELLSDVVLDASERRVSIWSVPVDFGPWFYLLLVTHAAPFIFLLSWTELNSAPRDNIASIIVTVTSGAAPLIFVAAVATIIELEVVVVLREWFRARQANEIVKARLEERRESLREGRQEGRQEGHRKGFEEGFEAGRKAEREAQAAANGKSSDRNGND